jgi:peptidoglycan/xylan/chitin deacetylase (PgdA/CDA1 family)/glycosyltransferase involved in cell wall biosynthesis
MRNDTIHCTAGILTFNSEAFLERCLKSLSGFGEILIADGGSTDATLDIARRYNCRIITQSDPGNPITDFASERNRLLEAATYDWFLSIDSDEIITPELKEEIRQITSEQHPHFLIYRVPYRIVSEDLSVWYRSFKTYYQHRFFNRKSGARYARKVHERIVFDPAKYPQGTVTGPWLVPLDIQLDFKIYKGKVDHRIRIMVEERPPRTIGNLLKRVTIEPVRNIGKQLIKFAYLRLRYPAHELTPAIYELYKLYSQWVFAKEAVRQYFKHLRGKGKHGSFRIAGFLASVTRPLRRQPEVCVLMYHAVAEDGSRLAVTPDNFEAQIAYLSAHKNIVTLDEVVAHVQGEPLPTGSVAITFDDGYADIRTTVLPILKKYAATATVFLPTDLEAYTDPAGTERMTWEDVRIVAETSLITFESHGRTHRALTRLSDQELNDELLSSRADINRELGKEPSYIAYPYGARNERVEQAALAAGYKAGFGITPGLVRCGTPLSRIPRVQVDGDTDLTVFGTRLTYATEVHRVLMKGIRSIIRV